MAIIEAVSASPLAAALLTAAALMLQARWQRRDSQAHEFRMAQERHQADLERLDREAMHRRREVNQERLQTAHRTLLGMLDQIVHMALMQQVTMSVQSEANRDYGRFGVLLREPVNKTFEPEMEMRLLASDGAAEAGSMAVSVARTLFETCLFSTPHEPGSSPPFDKIVKDLSEARNAYREALRLDIGAA